MKKRIEIEVDVPEGWESAGALRDPIAGEHYLSAGGTVAGPSGGGLGEPRLILRKVEPKRETRYGWCYAPWKTLTEMATNSPYAEIPVAVEFVDDKPVSTRLTRIDIPEGEGLSAAEAGR